MTNSNIETINKEHTSNPGHIVDRFIGRAFQQDYSVENALYRGLITKKDFTFYNRYKAGSNTQQELVRWCLKIEVLNKHFDIFFKQPKLLKYIQRQNNILANIITRLIKEGELETNYIVDSMLSAYDVFNVVYDGGYDDEDTTLHKLSAHFFGIINEEYSELTHDAEDVKRKYSHFRLVVNATFLSLKILQSLHHFQKAQIIEGTALPLAA